MNKQVKKCNLCDGDAVLKYEKMTGYIEDAFFDIYECTNCDATFVSPLKSDEKIYEYIYKQVEIVPGYERYYRYSELVKKVNNPLSLLCNSESVYWSVRESLMKYFPKKNVSILEIGSGLGYLTYSLNKAGYKTTGLDISIDAVKQAKEKYGDYYEAGDLFVVSESRKKNYDCVIMTEIIEHVEDPKSFIIAALSLLKDDGKLILTTPNKSAAPKENNIWQSDIPPVHLWLFAEESIMKLCKTLSKKCEFVDFTNYTKKFYSPTYILNIEQIQVGSPKLTKNGDVINKEVKNSFKKFIGLKLRWSISYIIRRFKHKEISKRTTTLCVVIY